MKQQSKLTSGHEQQSCQQSGTPGREFATPEELLRYDAAQTSPPERIADRLHQSISALPAPRKSSWWRRLFGQ